VSDSMAATSITQITQCADNVPKVGLFQPQDRQQGAQRFKPVRIPAEAVERLQSSDRGETTRRPGWRRLKMRRLCSRVELIGSAGDGVSRGRRPRSPLPKPASGQSLDCTALLDQVEKPSCLAAGESTSRMTQRTLGAGHGLADRITDAGKTRVQRQRRGRFLQGEARNELGLTARSHMAARQPNLPRRNPRVAVGPTTGEVRERPSHPC
jgi:hypothetical protein